MHRPHRHFHSKTGKKRDPQQGLQTADNLEPEHSHRIGCEGVVQQRRNIRGARIPIHGDHCHQHQNRPKEGIKEEFERRIDAFLAAPDADNQEHRDQACLEEQIEQHQIQRHEHAQHQGFQQQECDHVFLDAGGDAPTGGNGDRHQEGGQHYEQHRNAIDAHLVFQAQYPVAFFNELKPGIGRIKAGDDKDRQQERG